MKSMGIQAIIRRKPHRTTIPDKKAPGPLDKVNRQFRVPLPNMLRVSDFTCAASWRGPRQGHSGQWRSDGSIHVAFVIDACARRIPGWRVSPSAHAGFVPDALEQALHDRRRGKGMGQDRQRHALTLPEPIGNNPPAEAEANLHAAPETETKAAQPRLISLRQTRRGS